MHPPESGLGWREIRKHSAAVADRRRIATSSTGVARIAFVGVAWVVLQGHRVSRRLTVRLGSLSLALSLRVGLRVPEGCGFRVEALHLHGFGFRFRV